MPAPFIELMGNARIQRLIYGLFVLGLLLWLIYRLFVIALVMLLWGCDEPSEPPVTLGVQDWRPAPVGGPLEVRPLPPSPQVWEDYQDWARATPWPVARVYEATLIGSSNQTDFKVEVRRSETPLGRPEHTYVSFIYKDPRGGAYMLLWHRLGRHNADFLRLGDRPMRVWVTFNWRASARSMPILEIEGVEGMGPPGVLIARPGGELK